jgi:hypothetical protein
MIQGHLVLHLALFFVCVNLDLDPNLIEDEDYQLNALIAFKLLKVSHLITPILQLVSWIMRSFEMHTVAVLIQVLAIIFNYLPQLLAQWVIRQVLKEYDEEAVDWQWSNSGVWFLIEE